MSVQARSRPSSFRLRDWINSSGLRDIVPSSQIYSPTNDLLCTTADDDDEIDIK